MIFEDNFDNKVKYKLYKELKDLLHPTISKSNISEYKIVFKDEFLPVRIFYPKKLKDIKHIIIYIPGIGELCECKGKYSDICKGIASKSDSCVIGIDYFDEEIKYPNTTDRIYDIINYLYEEFIDMGFDLKDIYLMGDSFGGLLLNDINKKFHDNNVDYIKNNIYFYPLIKTGHDSMEFVDRDDSYRFDLLSINKSDKFLKKYLDDNYKCILAEDISYFPRSFIVCGDLDPICLEDEEFSKKIKDSEFVLLNSNIHGLLKNINTMKSDVFDKLIKFMK